MRKLIAGMAMLALWTGAAAAQNATDLAVPPETTRTMAGPSSSATTTRQTIDSRGVETNAKDTYDKSQSITSGNGALSAKTSTETTSQSTVSAPPPIVTKSTTSTNTTDEISH
jgi:hypothetical protein